MMRKLRYPAASIVGLLTAAALLCPARADGEEKISLRLDLKKRKTYRYRTLSKMTNTLVRNTGSEEESEIQQEIEHEIKCVDITPEGCFEVEFRYKKYRVTRISYVDGVEQKRVIDGQGIRIFEDDEIAYERTWDEVTDPAISSVNRLTRTVFRVTLDPAGRVVDYGNLDQLQSSFPDINLRQLTSLGVELPEDPVMIGAQWSSTSTIDLPVIPGSPTSGKTLENRHVYKLLGVIPVKKKRCAEVEMKISSQLKDVDPKKVKFSQTTAGKTLLDIETGLVYQASASMRQELEFDVRGIRTSGINTSETEIKLIK